MKGQRIVCRKSGGSYSSIFGEPKGPDDYSKKLDPVCMRVNPHICAILAGLISVEVGGSLAGKQPPSSPPEQQGARGSGTAPRPVMFRLRDGVQISGTLTSWDSEEFDGTFGRRQWAELRPDDAWRIFRRVINEDLVEDWIALGRMALLHDGLEKRAESAFHAARALDVRAIEEVERVRQEVAAIRSARRDEARAASGFERATLSPEAAEWPTDPWPALSPEAAEAARLTLFHDAEAVLEQAGLEIDPIESDFFIVYSDAPRADAAKWAVAVLDHWYREAAAALGVPETTNLFWGKALVFIFMDQDQFRLIETGIFNQIVSLEDISMTHYQGPKVFINAWRARDTVEFEAALVRGLVRGILHRFQSPRRLPPWANEGFPEFFAQRRIDESTYAEGNRPQGLRLVRDGFPAARVLEMQYLDRTWPGPNREGQTIGALLVEFLLKSDRAAFVEWIKAVKAGFEWKSSMEQHSRGSIQSIIDQFTRFYRAND